jgi:D-alanine transaminase
MIVYLNGKWLKESEVTISFQDRGFVFADSVYDATIICNRTYHRLERHLKRLQNGLNKLNIAYDVSVLKPILGELLNRNQQIVDEGELYIQISRGRAPYRAHGLPKLKEPTVLAYVDLINPAYMPPEKGKAILVEDKRWEMCDVKTTGILLNCMAKQMATDAGCNAAIFHRSKVVTEAHALNVFIVKNNEIYTHPNGPWILPGITRELVIEIAQEHRIKVNEVQFTTEDLLDADEIFLTGSVGGVIPYVEVDGKKIKDGMIGPISKMLREEYYAVLYKETH